MTEDEERVRIGGAIDGFRKFADHIYSAGDRVISAGSDADQDRRLAQSHIAPTGVVDGLVASVADHLVAWTDKAGYGTDPATIRLSIFADYTLFRPVIEALAAVVWILGPEDSAERISRSIQFANIELKKGEKFVGNLAGIGAADEEMAKTFSALRRELEAVCERTGLDPKLCLPSRAIDPTRFTRDAGQYVEGVDTDTFRFWAVSSAHAHSQLFTAMTMATRTEGKNSNGEFTYVEANSDRLVELFEFTAKLLNTAVTALNSRGFVFVMPE